MKTEQVYTVKEIFRSIQGEGARSGRPAVFVRFSGCNLWNGREQDRHSAICQFCDTDFQGTDGMNGGKYIAEDLCNTVARLWPAWLRERPFVVCTGGEPLLQLDDRLIRKMRAYEFDIAIETNGTIDLPEGIDWVCMSPKANAATIVRRGDEIKIVYPQAGLNPEDYEDWDFEHYFIQPKDGPDLEQNTRLSVAYCARHPRWKLSVQTHKLLALP